MGDLAGWKLAPVEPTPEMIDRGVSFALNVSISRDYRWTEYVSDLYGRMLSTAPSPTLPSRESIADIITAEDWKANIARTETLAEFKARDPIGHEEYEAISWRAAGRILALFTAPQPLAKPMPLDTVEGE